MSVFMTNICLPAVALLSSIIILAFIACYFLILRPRRRSNLAIEKIAKAIDPNAKKYDLIKLTMGRYKDSGYEVSYQGHKLSIFNRFIIAEPEGICWGDVAPHTEVELQMKDIQGMKIRIQRKSSPGFWDKIYYRLAMKGFKFENDGPAEFNKKYETYTNRPEIMDNIIDYDVRNSMQSLYGTLIIDEKSIKYRAYMLISDEKCLKKMIDLVVLVVRRVDEVMHADV